jgi:malate dehydrogenase
MVKALIEDTHEEIPTGVILQGEYGHKDTATGVPAILGKGGLVRIVEYKLNATEQQKMDATCKSVREKIDEGMGILKATA